jgi:hypothetical protein
MSKLIDYAPKETKPTPQHLRHLEHTRPIGGNVPVENEGNQLRLTIGVQTLKALQSGKTIPQIVHEYLTPKDTSGKIAHYVLKSNFAFKCQQVKQMLKECYDLDTTYSQAEIDSAWDKRENLLYDNVQQRGGYKNEQ